MNEHEYVRGTLVPTTYLEPLGRLFVWFCLLEEALDRALVIFSSADEKRADLIVKQFTSFKAKADLLKLLAKADLYSKEKPEDFKQIEAAINRATDANTLRNEIVHGRWAYADFSGDATVKKKSLTKSGAPKTTPLNIATINKASQAAYDAQVVLDATIIAVKMRKAAAS